MKRCVLLVNGIIAGCFIALFLYTVFGEGHLRQLATDHISGKLEPQVRRSATLAKAGLEVPALRESIK
jgi:hypothetical protein